MQHTRVSTPATPTTTDENAKSQRLEAFIPYQREEIIAQCLKDGNLPKSEHHSFKELCEILTAYLHFEFHSDAEEVKDCYAPFDPDIDTIFHNEREATPENEKRVIKLFKTIAERANYFEVTEADIEKALEEVTLIDLNTQVDMDDFDQVLCFARGDIFKKTTIKKLFKKKEIDVDVLQRVILLFKFKNEEYFNSSKKKRKQREGSLFEPGMIYTYFYKDVPKNDLELLFPNVRVGMNFRQKLLFAVPAIGGSVGVLIKIIPQLVIIAGLILFAVGGTAWAERFDFEINDDSVSLKNMATITAVAGAIIALGGLAFKQWSGYHKRQIKFLKEVSEQLFFRNLATNRSVFHRLIDSAEEEESKEMLLVLFHMLANPDKQFTRESLDEHVEKWMKDHFGAAVDFDIDGPIGNLSRLKGPACDGSEVSLLSIDGGILKTVPLADAKHVIDHLWDNAFQFNKTLS